MENIINALKSILVIELQTNQMSREKAMLFMNQVNEYVKKEIGIYDDYEDQSLKVLIFPSDRTNVQLLNSPYDAWEHFEDTLSERFNNIEEFIHELYGK